MDPPNSGASRLNASLSKMGGNPLKDVLPPSGLPEDDDPRPGSVGVGAAGHALERR